MKPLRIARWWASDYLYAGYGQVRAFLDRRDPSELRTGDARPVIILPGVWETWGFLRPLIDVLRAGGHPVHVLPALGRNGRPIPATAEVVSAYLAEHDVRDVVIVAHSKGGLIGKYVMSRLDPDERVTAMVAVCTPFAGSAYARFMLVPSLRAFLPTDATTLQLLESLEVNTRITTVAGVWDPHIPAAHELAGATNITLDDGGHFRLLASPEVARIVRDVASRP
ncbi:esterase/lipase family protein [Microbacterium invictum]|uniref:Pimeloyl-ACP methyl ester carboxylesterase n=1 Tax=Microbacterium invictum TaxID=515415 RepID=A0AA40VK89_9MICO|nr:alpha/beta hydrolase [Microbacterium invictum]MBB4138391.1 pimeloyl-ACP methyl ester carboxylesterase [Microbacterium invictum]